MARFLSQTIPELGDRPARAIIIDWIAAGCPDPEAASAADAERLARRTFETLHRDRFSARSLLRPFAAPTTATPTFRR